MRVLLAAAFFSAILSAQTAKLLTELIQIDTTDILFICCGAFNGLEDIVRRRTGQRGLGFGAEISTAEDDKDKLVDNPMYGVWAHHKPGASATVAETFS